MQTHRLACARQDVWLFQYPSLCGGSKRAWELIRAEASENIFPKYQRSWGAHRCKAEVAGKKGSACSPASGGKVPGSQRVCACARACVRGCAAGVVTRICPAWAKSSHFQHNHSVCLRAPACWTAAVGQVPEEGSHRARLPLISHLCCQNCSKRPSIHKTRLVLVEFLAK